MYSSRWFCKNRKSSFDSYNESQVLIDSVNKFIEIHGCYQERVLVDIIYKTRENVIFCNEHNIRISVPKLGRPVKEIEISDKNR